MRLMIDLVKADGIIDYREIKALTDITERYGIRLQDESSADSYTLAQAIDTLNDPESVPDSLRYDLLGDFTKLALCDGFCSREEALLILALQYTLSPHDDYKGRVISVDSLEPYRTDAQILYVESEVDRHVNDHIKTYYREICQEAALAGYDFVYLPKLVSKCSQLSTDDFVMMASLLYPSEGTERCQQMARWVSEMTTATFSKELLLSRFHQSELFDVDPSLLVKIGYSYVQGSYYTNYLLVNASEGVLETVRTFFDTLGTYHQNMLCRYQRDANDMLAFSGFYKQLFDFYMLRKGIVSPVVIDVLHNDIRLPDAGISLKLGPREKALYTLFLLESPSGGINFNMGSGPAARNRYERLAEKLRYKYSVIYKEFTGKDRNIPDILVPENRRPMISKINACFSAIGNVLNQVDNYRIVKNDFGCYAVSLPSTLCCCCGSDAHDVRPISEDPRWLRLMAL